MVTEGKEKSMVTRRIMLRGFLGFLFLFLSSLFLRFFV